MSPVFDEPNLVVSAGLIPAVGLAARVGLADLADEHVRVPVVGANAGAKVMSLVAGMCAGADSIADMGLLSHGAMGTVFTGVRAPSTLGSFLRGFTFGHVRQLDAVACRVLIGLARQNPGLLAGIGSGCVIDIDDTVKPVFGARKQGAEFGYTGQRGLNAQLAVISTDRSAPVIAATRLRRGARNSSHGAVRMITDTIATARRCGAGHKILVRADSAYCTSATVAAVADAGATFSMAITQSAPVRRAIESIPEGSWTRIDYPQAILDTHSGELVSAAEVAEVDYVAFTSKAKKHHRPGRLIVRRIPELNKAKLKDQDPLFPLFRYHAVFSNSDKPLVEAEAEYRGHAIIEQVIADLKASALAHLPSGKFTANAAWTVCAAIAFNLTRAIGVNAGGRFAKATTATIRNRIINLPARIARSARRLTIHLPHRWLWATSWLRAWATSTNTAID
jgi:hypothetical protein